MNRLPLLVGALIFLGFNALRLWQPGAAITLLGAVALTVAAWAYVLICQKRGAPQ